MLDLHFVLASTSQNPQTGLRTQEAPQGAPGRAPGGPPGGQARGPLRGPWEAPREGQQRAARGHQEAPQEGTTETVVVAPCFLTFLHRVRSKTFEGGFDAPHFLSSVQFVGIPFQTAVDTFQGTLTSYVLIAIRILPCNGAPVLLEQAFDMRISIAMQAQCKTRLHVALVTHIYRQTKGTRK